MNNLGENHNNIENKYAVKCLALFLAIILTFLTLPSVTVHAENYAKKGDEKPSVTAKISVMETEDVHSLFGD